ncbi:MAG: N-acetyltransferase family protein [Oscillospiraceae bacterium]|nr:N-acetyltransferase family protein [Oscillospiraceae bacterium]
MENKIKIRMVTPDDAEELLSIYAPYVLNTAITFEYDVPTADEFRLRIENTLKKYPYIAAERDGELLGYAYTGPFKNRAAYDHAVETTVYVKENARRQGIGRMLYAELEIISRRQNITNLNACIGCPAAENDEYLTMDSVEFHKRMGYRIVGEFHGCGYKFGRWYNMVWAEKIICPHDEEPLPVIPFPNLKIILNV